MTAASEESSDRRIGAVIAGRYRLDALLGAGGSGVVYRARHIRTGRDVAVKLLRAHAQDALAAAARLEREAIAAVSVSHSNVVEVLDFGEEDELHPYLVLELLTGATLQQTLDRRGPLAAQETFELALPLLGALAVAHDRNLLHRDIKPANVFLCETPDGRRVPKLLDFGIVKMRDAAALTQPGRAIGTAGFMAPEHVRGDALGAGSDLWSFAALLYTCLVGRPPFGAGALSSDVAPPLPTIRGCPAAIALLCVIERGLEWDPLARYADARAFARALLQVAHHKGLSIPAAPDPIGLRSWPDWLAELGAVTLAPSASPPSRELERTGEDSGAHACRPAQAGEILVERFELRGALGSGEMGAVYEALDRSNGERVALKMLHRLDAEAIYRIKREFRALSEIAQPNLVALHELFSDHHGRFFFTMELLRGVSFYEHVRDRDDWRGFDEARLRVCLVQLARGVGHLHESGKLHRDLKPSNVLVTPEGRLVIVDFGLTQALGGSMPAQHDFQGTPLYAAPEQGASGELLPASDWYAVGAMLFEALTGRVPFPGGARQVMRDKAEQPPPRPSASTTHALPADLDELCVRLLARNPAERANGRDVLAMIERSALEPMPEALPGFAGREHELARLDAAFERAQCGELVAALVRGRSGIGKTTLVRRFLDGLARDGRAVVLCGRCYPQEALPYKAFDGVIDALSSHLRALPIEESARLTPHDHGALIQIFPVLRRVPGLGRTSGRHEDSFSLRHRAFDALRELLTRLTAIKPVAIFVDDLQWGDDDSARLLHDVLSPPIARLFFVATSRDDALASPALSSELFGREAGARVAAIELGPLHPAALAELAGRALGDAEVGREIARKASGHPMLAGELVRFVRTRGELSALADVSLEDAIAAQLARLTPGARALLEVVSVAGKLVPRSTALRLAPDASLTALRELRLGRLLCETVHGGRPHLEPYHDQVRDGAVRAIDPERARALHGALGDALHAGGDARLEAVAHHYLHAGREDEARLLAERAALQAAEALAFERSADLLGLAARLARGTADEPRLSFAAADACVRAGRAVAAAEGYAACAALASGSSEDSMALRFELHQRAMSQYFVGGHCTKGTALLHELAADLGLRIAPARDRSKRFHFAKFLASLWALIFLGWPRLRKAEPLQSSRERLRAQLRLLWSAAAPLVHVKGADAAALAWQVLALAARLGEREIYGQALALRMTTLAFIRGRRSRLLDLRMTQARALVADAGDRWHGHFVSVMQGVQALILGEFERALEATLHAATSTDSRTPFALAVQSTARATILPALYWRGRVSKSSELSEAWIKEAADTGDRHLEINFRIVGAHRFLRVDDAARARQEIEQARGIEVDYAHPAFNDPWWEAAIELYDGHPDRALEICMRMSTAFARSSAASHGYRAMWSLTVGGCASGILAAAPGDASAREQLASCRDAVERARTRVHRAVRSHLQGALDLHAGRRGQGLAALEHAVLAYDELGMQLWGASLRLSLARLGHPHAVQLERSAREAFSIEGIVSPERWSRMLAPGIAPSR